MKKDKKSIIVHLYELRDPRVETSNYIDSVKYVGMTVQSLNDRLLNHLSSARNRKNKPTYCHNWIKGLIKNGLKPTIHLIEEVIGYDNGALREIELIKSYRELGCKLTNLSSGGEGVSGNYISLAKKRIAAKNNHTRSNSRKVYQFDLEGNFIEGFDSFKQASLSTKVHREGIRLTAEGESQQAGGFLWSFFRDNVKIPEKINNVNGIDQFELDGTFVKHWKTAAEAGKFLNHSPHNINACAKGFKGFNTAYGFLWKYAKIKRSNN